MSSPSSEIKPLRENCYRPSKRNREEVPVLAARLGWNRNQTIDQCVTLGKKILQKRIKAMTAQTAKQS